MRSKAPIALLLFVTANTAALLAPAPLGAATINVTTTEDNLTAGDCVCTLREAIRNANADGDTTAGDCAAGTGLDIVDIPAGVYTLTITGNNDNNNNSGDLDIRGSDITLRGASADSTIIQAGTSDPNSAGGCSDCVDRVLDFPGGVPGGGGSPVTALVQDLTLRHGRRGNVNGGGFHMVRNNTVTFRSVTITRNRNDGNGRGGGGANDGGTLRIENSTVSLNHATTPTNRPKTGGIFTQNTNFGGSATIVNSTISGNSGYVAGGVMVLSGFPDATNPGMLTIINSSIVGNILSGPSSAGFAGGVVTGGFTNNVGFQNDNSSITTFQNVVLGNNTGRNCAGFGTAIDSGGNFADGQIGGTLCPGTFTLISTADGTDIDHTLATNGGPTETHSLPLMTSLPVDAGTLCAGPVPANDQRGAPRVGTCDSGAFEFAGAVPVYDTDGDGVPNATDNCPHDANPTQTNSNGSARGDACDAPPPSCDNCADLVSEFSDYDLVYELNIPGDANYGAGTPAYAVDNSGLIGTFDRVAYCLELDAGSGLDWAWVSMDDFTGATVTQTGVPVSSTGATFETGIAGISAMNVHSNVLGVLTGTGITTGNLEFWPDCYLPPGVPGTPLPGGNGSTFDFDDSINPGGPPVCNSPGGYGSMQIHNYGASQTILAYNRWNQAGTDDDIGIGNATTGQPDWTDAKNASSYTARKNLRVFVREVTTTSTVDFGDAPDPMYPTLDASTGAKHTVGALFLGASVDTDADGQPSAMADGDDNDTDGDDEDGVTFTTTGGLLVVGETATLDVVASATGGLLDAWVDFNDNGSWADSGEQVFASTPLPIAGTNSLFFSVPAGATLGTTFARFRVSTAGGLPFTGPATDGEVEDYQVTIAARPDCTVSTTPLPVHVLGGTQTATVSMTGTDADAADTLTASITSTLVTGQALDPASPSSTSPLNFDFKWSPTATQGGSYNVEVTVSDGTLSDTCSFGVEVNEPPMCTVSTTPTTGLVGVPFSRGFTATDSADGSGSTNNLSSSHAFTTPATGPIAGDPEPGNDPSLSTISASTTAGSFTFDWIPHRNQSGSYTVELTVNDNYVPAAAAGTATCSADFDLDPDADLDGVKDSMDPCPFNPDPAAVAPACGCPFTETLVSNRWYQRSMACEGSDTLDGNYDEIIALPLPYASLDVDPGAASEDTWWAFERVYAPLPGSYSLLGAEDTPSGALPLGRSHWIYLDDRFFAPVGEGPSTTIDPVDVTDDGVDRAHADNGGSPGTLAGFPGTGVIQLLESTATAESVPNMMGHPYLFDVCWRDVRFLDPTNIEHTLAEAVADDAVAPVFHKWNGGSYDAFDGSTGSGIGGTLEAGDGIWVHAYVPGWSILFEPTPAPTLTAPPGILSACDDVPPALLFRPDPAGATSGPTEVTSASGATAATEATGITSLRPATPGTPSTPSPVGRATRNPGFFVRLIASSSSGLEDRGNVFGQHPDARRGLDDRDLWEIPADVEPNLSLFFPSIGGEEDQRIYGSDFHPLSSDQDEWLFVVSTSKTEDTITLTWETPSSEPGAELRLYRSELVDVATEEVIPVEPGGSYSFPAGAAPRAFIWRLRP